MKVHLLHSSQNKSHKTVEIKGFPTILFNDERIRIRIRMRTESGFLPDPEHYLLVATLSAKRNLASLPVFHVWCAADCLRW
jgi:hypothetical protein